MASNIPQTDSNIRLICLLVGIPASGKSVFVRAFREYITSVDSKLNIICVEFDTFLPRDTRCTPKDESADPEFKWRKHRDELKLKIDTFLSSQLVTGEAIGCQEVAQFSVAPCPKDGVSILLLDDTFHYRSMRYEYFRLARKYKLGFIQLFFEVGLQESIFRNKNRENKVPEETIVAINEQMASPVGSPFKWERHTVPLDTSKEIPFSLVVTRIVEVLRLPIPTLENLDMKIGAKEKSRKDTLSSVTHQCDIILRKLIGSLIKNASESGMETKEVRIFAEQCNTKRREVLKVVAEDGWVEGHVPLDLESAVSDMLKEAML